MLLLKYQIQSSFIIIDKISLMSLFSDPMNIKISPIVSGKSSEIDDIFIDRKFGDNIYDRGCWIIFEPNDMNSVSQILCRSKLMGGQTTSGGNQSLTQPGSYIVSSELERTIVRQVVSSLSLCDGGANL